MNNKQYTIPIPIIDEKEEKSLDYLTDYYKKLTDPKLLSIIGRQVADKIPDKIKIIAKALTDTISEQELFAQVMDTVAKAFSSIEEIAAKYTINRKAIIKNVAKTVEENKIEYSQEICLARSYDIAGLVDKYRTGDIVIALAEGAGTGWFGLPAIPFNIVLITFICYRAVQNVATYYGYDVKQDPSEMVIAGEVLSSALAPTTSGSNELSGSIVKVLAFGEIGAVKDAVKTSWFAMAQKGGLAKLIVQMRALANKAAQKALEKAGEKGLENSVFKKVLEQIGKKLSQKTVGRMMPGLGAIIGGAFDVNQMKTVIAFADTFYQKRFILEKEERIKSLVDGLDVIDIFISEETE